MRLPLFFRCMRRESNGWTNRAFGNGMRFMRLDCAEDNEFLNSYYDSMGYRLAGRCEDGVYIGNKREKVIRP